MTQNYFRARRSESPVSMQTAVLERAELIAGSIRAVVYVDRDYGGMATQIDLNPADIDAYNDRIKAEGEYARGFVFFDALGKASAVAFTPKRFPTTSRDKPPRMDQIMHLFEHAMRRS